MKRILLLTTIMGGIWETSVAQAQQQITIVEAQPIEITIPVDILKNYHPQSCAFLQSANKQQLFWQCVMEPSYGLTADVSDTGENKDGATREESSRLSGVDQAQAKQQTQIEAIAPTPAIVPELADGLTSSADIPADESAEVEIEGCGGAEWTPVALWLGKIDTNFNLKQSWFFNEGVLTEKSFTTFMHVNNDGELFATPIIFDDLAAGVYHTEILKVIPTNLPASFEKKAHITDVSEIVFLSDGDQLIIQTDDNGTKDIKKLHQFQEVDWLDRSRITTLGTGTATIIERPNTNLLLYVPITITIENQAKVDAIIKQNNPNYNRFGYAQNEEKAQESSLIMCLSPNGVHQASAIIPEADIEKLVAMQDNRVSLLMVDQNKIFIRNIDNNCHVSSAQAVELPVSQFDQEGTLLEQDEDAIFLHRVIAMPDQSLAILYMQAAIAQHHLVRIDRNGRVVQKVNLDSIMDGHDQRTLGLDIIDVPGKQELIISVSPPYFEEITPKLYKVNFN
jgi:hypothetical protein